MNKKILVISVLLLTFALLSIPVMGAPAIKKPATIVVTGGVPVVDVIRFVGQGRISHATGGTPEDAKVTLTIGGDTYEGDWDSDWKVNRNWPKEKGVIRSTHTMTFEGKGTFVGVNQRRIYGPDPFIPDRIVDHCVYKGISGMFTGWTLKISYDGPPGGASTGYAIIPK
jgi:hypothetical protein